MTVGKIFFLNIWQAFSLEHCKCPVIVSCWNLEPKINTDILENHNAHGKHWIFFFQIKRVVTILLKGKRKCQTFLNSHGSGGCSCSSGLRGQYKETVGQTSRYKVGFDPMSQAFDWIYTNQDSVQEPPWRGSDVRTWPMISVSWEFVFFFF